MTGRGCGVGFLGSGAATGATTLFTVGLGVCPRFDGLLAEGLGTSGG